MIGINSIVTAFVLLKTGLMEQFIYYPTQFIPV